MATEATSLIATQADYQHSDEVSPVDNLPPLTDSIQKSRTRRRPGWAIGSLFGLRKLKITRGSSSRSPSIPPLSDDELTALWPELFRRYEESDAMTLNSAEGDDGHSQKLNFLDDDPLYSDNEEDPFKTPPGSATIPTSSAESLSDSSYEGCAYVREEELGDMYSRLPASFRRRQLKLRMMQNHKKSVQLLGLEASSAALESIQSNEPEV